MALKVSDFGEKELVKYIIANSRSIVPDDGAVLEFGGGKMISTCDMLICSRHFPQNMSYFQMGFKAVTVSVSDLAAMGAEPRGFLLAIALPGDFGIDEFKEIIDGVLSACDFYGIPLIGGDTNEASEIVISGTAFGSCDNPLEKNTAEDGDLVVLTGDIGLAALGFNLDDYNNIYTKCALKPIARLAEAIKIRDAGATSATDITDGLASELYEMKRDNIGFMIYEDWLDISDEYRQLAGEFDLNYLDLILYVGEDFELVFTISEDNLQKLGIDYKVIGKVNTTGKVEIVLEDGLVEEIENRGYEHYES